MNLRLKEIYYYYYYYTTTPNRLAEPYIKNSSKSAHVLRHDDKENHMTPYFTKLHQVKIMV